MIAETANLIANLQLKDGLSGPAQNAQRSLSGLNQAVDNTSRRTSERMTRMGQHARAGLGEAQRNIARLGALTFGAVAANIAVGVRSLNRIDAINAQTQAVLKSTGGVANVTADHIQRLTGELEDLNATEQETLQIGANLLLTFTNIRNEAGKGNDIFDQTVRVADDMSRALGQDMKSSAIQLGKALNDPVKGITALQRVGVAFTEGQRDQIKALVESGKTLQAQKIILRELNTEFGGSAGALGAYRTGQIEKMRHAFGSLQEALATGFLPIISKVASRLNEVMRRPETLATVERLGNSLAGVFDQVVGVVERLPWGSIGDAMRLMGQGSKMLLDAFMGLPPWIQTAVITGWGLNKLTGGAVIKIGVDLVGGVVSKLAGGLFGRGQSPASPMYVAPVGGSLGGGAGAAAGGGRSLIGRAMSAVSILGAVTIAGASIAALGEQFGAFQRQVADAQADLQEKADAAKDQTAEAALANLRQMNRKLSDVQGLDRILADTFGGEQIADGLANLSRSVAQNGRLSASQITEAIGVLEEAQRQALARGNQKVADAIGQDIATLRNRQVAATREAATRTGTFLDRLKTSIRSPLERSADSLQTIKNQPTKISVTVPVTTSVSVRDVQTSTRTSSRYGFQAV